MNKLGAAKITDSLQFGMQLALVGGFMDGYTYVNRGNVFATGQTGNLVLIGIRTSAGDFYGACMAAIPIIFFIIGVIAYEHFVHKLLNGDSECWQRYILMIEIVIMYIVGLLPSSLPYILANALIAFASAMQFCTFRTLVNGPYATVFCTGNIRSCAEKYYNGIALKNKEDLKSANRYSLIILSFLFGGILSSSFSKLFGVKTIWICCLLLLVPLTNLYRDIHTVHQELNLEE